MAKNGRKLTVHIVESKLLITNLYDCHALSNGFVGK